MHIAVQAEGGHHHATSWILAGGAGLALIVCGPAVASLAALSPGVALPVVVCLLVTVGAVVLSSIHLWELRKGFLFKRVVLGAFLFAALLAALVVGVVWPRAVGLNGGSLDWQDSLRLGLSLFVPAGAILGALTGVLSWRLSRRSALRLL